ARPATPAPAARCGVSVSAAAALPAPMTKRRLVMALLLRSGTGLLLAGCRPAKMSPPPHVEPGAGLSAGPRCSAQTARTAGRRRILEFSRTCERVYVRVLLAATRV